MDRPLLLVDVDGVISLFGFDPMRPPSGRFQMVDGIAHYLSATAGDHLRALSDAFELVWCTGWEEKANEYLPHALGLEAPLPHLSFDRHVGRTNAHWKLSAIEAFAGPRRPLAWIDDFLDERCREWARERAGATLLVRTESDSGLSAAHVTTLLAWASAQNGAAPAPR